MLKRKEKSSIGSRLYVVRKYIRAGSINEALKLEKSTAPFDVYVDSKWFENSDYYDDSPNTGKIGFKADKPT